MKTRFTMGTVGGKFSVYRMVRGYPRGVFVGHFKSESGALSFIRRQDAEDNENRVSKVRDYLAERSTRAALVSEPTDQLRFF